MYEDRKVVQGTMFSEDYKWLPNEHKRLHI